MISFSFLPSRHAVTHANLFPHHVWTPAKNGCQILGFWILWEKVIGSSFSSSPPFTGVHMTVIKDPVQAQVLATEIAPLLQKEAIDRVSSSEQYVGFYSIYFLIPKKESGLRPILV